MKALCLVALLALAVPALAEDTLAPDPPAAIEAEYVPNSITITWAASPSPDVALYRVYLDPACDVLPGCEFQLKATRLPTDELTFTGPFGQVDFNGLKRYYVTAVDTAGNESSQVTPSTLGLGDGASGLLVFASPAPNPSRGDVAFSWTMPSAGTARLAIVDLAGRTVRMLAGGMQGAGPQRVTWDGRDTRGQLVRPGAYFARLDSPWGSRSRMVIRTN
jgi:hypothetical protein